MKLPNTDKERFNKKWIWALVSVLLLFIASVLIFDTRLPVALLFGPFLFFLLVPSMKFSVQLLHLLPFIFILLLRIFFGNVGDLYKIYEDEYYMTYDLLSISSFIYYMRLIYKKTKQSDLPDSLVFYIKQLFLAYLLLTASYFIFFLNRLNFSQLNFFDPSELLLTILGVIFILSLVYKIANYKEVKHIATTIDFIPDQDVNRYGLSDQEIKIYGLKVERFFDNSREFLDINFNLDKLADILQIPKHHLSVCFANYFQKNFYNVLAKYRIKKAIDLAINQPLLTWESIAHDCGYSSRTTFNKHFKNITGSLPSEFSEEQLMLLKAN